MKCQYCANRISTDAYNCPYCGNDARVSRHLAFERRMLALSLTLAAAFVSCLMLFKGGLTF